MAKRFAESPVERFGRYEKARSRMLQWESLLTDAYSYSIPNKREFHTITIGERKVNDIFDSTAILGVNAFANNLQSILMPPFRKWFKLIPGDEVPPNEENQVEKALQEVTEILFKFLNLSNFALVANESLQELAIGTGVMILNEGTGDLPFNFLSVPISRMAFEEGAEEKLENFWRRIELPGRQIKRLWPNAKLSDRLEKQISASPDIAIQLIEGTIFYPDNSEGSQYFYYLQEETTKNDILTEFREFSPWIGFRFSKAPGEIVGRGPVLTALPDIRTVNKMKEFVLRSAKFNAFPAYLAPSTSAFNPYNLTIEPGSIIPIEPQFVSPPGIQPIPTGGNPNIAQAEITALQETIREILFADPLTPQAQPNVSATEIAIRQQNWIRRSGSAFGRLTVELLEPVIVKTLSILRKKGLIPDIKIDGKRVAIQYESPILDLQSQEDVQRMQQWLQSIQATYGQFSILALDVGQYPHWLAEKMNVDLKLIKDPEEMTQAFLALQEQIQSQLGGQPQPEVPTAQPGVIPPVTPFVS